MIRPLLVVAFLALAGCGGSEPPSDVPPWHVANGWVACPGSDSAQQTETADTRFVTCFWPCSTYEMFRDRMLTMTFACKRSSNGTWTDWQITDFNASPAGFKSAFCPT